MKDSPKLTSLYYHITERCNLRCKHCWVEGKNDSIDNHLSLDEAKHVVLQALPLGLENVKLTGGEPFLVPWILDFVEFCSKNDVITSFETNGTLLTPEIAKRLARSKTMCVSISLDGSRAEIHEDIRRTKGCFEAAVNGIRYAVEAKLNTVILTAIHKGNLSDLDQIIAFAERLGVNGIKLNPIVPIGRGHDLELEGELLNIEERSDLFHTVTKIQKTTNIRIEMHFPLICCAASDIRKDMYCSCNIKHMLGLMADGALCLCGLAYTDNRAIYANVRNTTLRKIWFDNPPKIIQDIRSGLPNRLTGVCGRCIFKYECLGGCRAKAFTDSGTVLGPHPICRQALEAGLVPPGRLIYEELKQPVEH